MIDELVLSLLLDFSRPGCRKTIQDLNFKLAGSPGSFIGRTGFNIVGIYSVGASENVKIDFLSKVIFLYRVVLLTVPPVSDEGYELKES